MILDEILEEIKKAKTISILTHESPDGDAIGSSMGMKLILNKLGKDADVIIPEYPRIFDFLPYINEIKSESDIKEYDLCILVDVAQPSRVALKEYFENAKKTIIIDHHRSNINNGDLNFVKVDSPACCEIIAEICKYFKIEISKEIGTCLMTGIITDTGGFQYKGINSKTFDFASEFIKIGVDVPKIYEKAFATKTKANFELMKKVVDRMEFLEKGKVVFTYLTNEDMIEVDAKSGDHEGLVNIGKDVEGVEVSIFIRQKDDENAYKISLRSKEYVDVCSICSVFGGGGHQRASGALIKGNVEQVKEMVMQEVRKVL